MRQPKPGPRVLTVSKAWHLTPNMIRVTFAGEALAGLPEGREGANCKLMLPEPGEAQDAFVARLASGPTPARRTYTVRHHRPEALELDIDFVDHGDGGPASAWARTAGPGSFLGFGGPGPVKLKSFEADYYLLAADMSAIPVVAATLEAMPRDAKGLAVFEVTSDADIQPIDAPDGIEMRWMVHADPHRPSSAQVDAIRALDWPAGRIQTCIAGEHSAIRALKAYLIGERGLTKDDAYISGYWKIGLIEDDHQALKRSEAA
ncbi:MAG: siderophore-interacting protein [Pseudomonadota bacterium]